MHRLTRLTNYTMRSEVLQRKTQIRVLSYFNFRSIFTKSSFSGQFQTRSHSIFTNITDRKSTTHLWPELDVLNWPSKNSAKKIENFMKNRKKVELKFLSEIVLSLQNSFGTSHILLNIEIFVKKSKFLP